MQNPITTEASPNEGHLVPSARWGWVSATLFSDARVLEWVRVMFGSFDAGGAGPSELAVSRSLDLVSAWVETLHGHGDCARELRQIARHVGAKGIDIVRIELPDRTTGSVLTTQSAAIPADNVLCAALVDSVGFGHLRVGQVHWASDLLADETFDRRWTNDRKFRSAALAAAAIIVLERRPSGRLDVAEIQYGVAPNGPQLRALAMMAPILSRRWANRQPGLAHHLLKQSRAHETSVLRPAGNVAVLDAANPAGLTRAEFRLCALINNGVDLNDLAMAAGIRPSTAKAHLRSIYDKTGCRNRAALVQKLMSQQPALHGLPFIGVAISPYRPSRGRRGFVRGHVAPAGGGQFTSAASD